ncbi:hypothetical protein ABIG04_007869 [Bradyrhizobium japonicum]
MSSSEDHWEVGTDIGGTFTDIIAIRRDSAEARIAKVPSRPDAPVQAMLEAIEAVGLRKSEVRRFVHGTTRVTNAIVENRLPKVALVATEGFADVLEIARYRRRDLYRLDIPPKSPPLVPPERCFGLAERLDHEGRVLKAPDEAEIERLVAWLKQTGVQSVAVALLHAYANPVHEKMLGERLKGCRRPCLAVARGQSRGARIRTDVGDRVQRGRDAAKLGLGIEIAEHGVRVGDGRLKAAAAIAGRPRLGAGALRPDRQAAGTVSHDRSAAGPDGTDRKHRLAQRLVAEHAAVGHLGLTVDDQADVGRGAAHVEGEHARCAELARDADRCRDAGRRPRHRHHQRPPLHGRDRDHGSGRMKHLQAGADRQTASASTSRPRNASSTRSRRPWG